jgi:cyanophycinase-like exopeptidase
MLLPFVLIGQNYTSFKIGNTTDVMTNPSGGVCLMGGATEDDNAMKWFLENANGGDVLILRTSGGSGYNSYFYEDLGVQLNSVETIVCHNESASHETYLIQKIQQAEAIWFAGGDQWTYISYWRNSPVASAINDAITNRNIVKIFIPYPFRIIH